jgi:DNA mismatch repair protein PMS2
MHWTLELKLLVSAEGISFNVHSSHPLTCLEIRFKEHGSESIEVIDNGSGIREDNYASLALKHHTSKLSSFHDLTLVTTFGFRGEALSSLCELSNVQVVTATKEEEPVGTVLELNRDGTIRSKDKRVARQVRM